MLKKMLSLLKSNKVKITCLGGAGEIGMNLFVYETSRQALVVDYGVMFTDSSMPGIDCIYPDPEYLRSIRKKVKAIIFTHGHEDHIGGAMKFMDIFNIPIYTGKFTAKLLEHKLAKYSKDIHIIESDKRCHIAGFDVDFISVTHSIPDTFGLRLSYGSFTALHLSDFRVEDTQKLLSKITETHVNCLLLDSTNADSQYSHNRGEDDVYDELLEIFKQAQGRIFFTTFASNVQRINSVIKAAKVIGRKIVLEGAAMERITRIAVEMELIDLPEDMLVISKKAINLDPNTLIYLVSGCQGEYASALHSIALNERKVIHMIDNDMLVFSSRVIPGNEGNVNYMINSAMRRGVDVIEAKDRPIHTSGHLLPADMRTIIAAVHPDYFIPIHGEYIHLKKAVSIAIEAGITKEQCLVIESGEQLTFENGKEPKKKEVPASKIYADFRGNFLFDETGLSMRRQVARDGVVVVLLGKKSTQIHTYGFTLSDFQKDRLNLLLENQFDESLTHEELTRKTVKHYFRKYLDRRPLIDLINR